MKATGVGAESDYLRAAEAAAWLNVSPTTVSRWAKEGKVAHFITLGGHRRFPRLEIERLAAELRSSSKLQLRPARADEVHEGRTPRPE